MKYTARKGRYGEFGGIFLPEILMAPLAELTKAWQHYRADHHFKHELRQLLNQYAGRPTPLTEIAQFAAKVTKARIFLKREDLLHTGAHKLNNALGQCLLAKKMGKTRIIAETGAGQHGVATAAACARLGLTCEVYMGSADMRRQAPNVTRMQLMGAKVIATDNGAATLKEAVNAALRDWSASFADTYYCLGSALGPHPYPEMVAAFQTIIGKETRRQCLQQLQQLPTHIVACVGGGSNAIGIFTPFLNNPEIKLFGIEAGGHGNHLGEHAARFLTAMPGILHGCYTYILQNAEGQIAPTASISAGLDYPAVSPQHAYLFKEKRVTYCAIKDTAALAALKLLASQEGILCALESAHALAFVMEQGQNFDDNDVIIVNLSGRGDKDLPQLMQQTSA